MTETEFSAVTLRTTDAAPKLVSISIPLDIYSAIYRSRPTTEPMDLYISRIVSTVLHNISGAHSRMIDRPKSYMPPFAIEVCWILAQHMPIIKTVAKRYQVTANDVIIDILRREIVR